MILLFAAAQQHAVISEQIGGQQEILVRNLGLADRQTALCDQAARFAFGSEYAGGDQYVNELLADCVNGQRHCRRVIKAAVAAEQRLCGLFGLGCGFLAVAGASRILHREIDAGTHKALIDELVTEI